MKKRIESLLKEGLERAARAGISPDSLSRFLTIIGCNYHEGGLLFIARATNGWDENNPKTLSQLIGLNKSQLIRVIREVSRHVYGEHGDDYVAYTQVCRFSDCDAGNPSITLFKATKEQNDQLFAIDMERLKPSVVIGMLGDSVAENGWQASIWDGWLNNFPGQYHEVKKISICQRTRKGRTYTYTASLWKLERDDEKPVYFIFADRPESLKLNLYTTAIYTLLEEIHK